MSRSQAAAARRSLWKDARRHRFLFLLLLPGTLYLILNNYLPMFGLIIAFKNVNFTDGILRSPWSGFDNFKFLFSTTDAWVITRNTVLYNLLFIAVGLVLSIAFAVLLNEVRNRVFRSFFQSAMFFPYFLSFVIVGYLVFALLSIEHGFVNNHILAPLGMEPIDWYNDPKYWPYILTITNLWKNIGYGTVIYLAAIIGVESSYYEAALIDGASKWRQFGSITLPSIMPVVVVLTLLNIGRIFYADFGLFYNVPLHTGLLYPTTLVIDTYVYDIMVTRNDIGMSTAVGLYQAAVGFVLVFLSNWFVRRVNKENALF
ncbi:ABC transporter permease subunit [Cohnella ginsengisoli]|uniref:ABC transporter permease subunit n=1 Tax=Cohnella ginsengisoli TaxID=425004 RepID=A0A9X4KFX6_9BACL|nr:ABC transporter permease subunit [Cohnella ginsengisoli]MDG0791408.1 ABC transporter permease subunit [Cohnella ginsengisoli]